MTAALGRNDLEKPPRRSSPYQGLVPFGDADAEWFFGRNEAREIVLDMLRAYRVSVLYGESGVGKSSLLRASVFAHVRREATAAIAAQGRPEALALVFSDWVSEDPIGALKEAIGAASTPGVLEAAVQVAPDDAAAQPPGGTLAEVLATSADRTGSVMFVILDQLEEFFLYHAAYAAGDAFLEELAGAIRRRDVAANFLLSIREDSLSKLDRLQARVPGLLDNLVRLEHLDAHEARDAIERPLAHWNEIEREVVTIEPDLVTELLAQVRAGKLLAQSTGGIGQVKRNGQDVRIEAPYLQLVLIRIWEEERAAGSDVLRLTTLQRLGGAERIVRGHLDDVLDRLSAKDREAAALALRYLVTPSATKIAYRVSDLASYTGLPAQRLERVLSALAGDARILRPVATGVYEIYHDALAAGVLDWRQRYEAQSERRRYRSLALSVGGVIVGIMVALYLANALSSLEDQTIGARFAIRGPRPPSDVKVVGIDDATFQQIGQQFPFPRTTQARLITQLVRAGAKAIAFDIVFSDPSSLGQKDDIAMLNAINDSGGRTVFSIVETDSNGEFRFLGSGKGAALLRAVGSHAGSGLLPGGGTAVIRTIKWGVSNGQQGARELESFGLVAAQVATKRQIPPAALGGDSARIDYAGSPGTIPQISFWRVLRRQFPPALFRGKIVVVGAVAPALQDIHPTPVSNYMTGPEIQANVIETALRGFPLRPKKAIDVPLIILFGIVAPVATILLGWTATLAFALVTGALYLVGAQVAFDHGVLLPVTYPLLALILATLILTIAGVAEWWRRGARPG